MFRFIQERKTGEERKTHEEREAAVGFPFYDFPALVAL